MMNLKNILSRVLHEPVTCKPVTCNSPKAIRSFSIFNFQLSIILLLFSCTGEGDGLPGGRKAVEFVAGGLETVAVARSTAEGNWEGVASVAVEVGGEVKEYAVTPTAGNTGEAALKVKSGVPFYWDNSTLNVEAWYPFTTGSLAKPAVVVKADQSVEANYRASDFVEFSGSVAFVNPVLAFVHRTARVVVTLTPGGGVANLDGATVKLVNLSGVEGASDGSAEVTPRLETNADGTITCTALLAPRSLTAGTAFVRVTLGGNTYVYTLEAGVTLQGGKQHDYTLAVSNKGLTLLSSNITPWGSGATGGGTLAEMTRVDLSAGSKTISDNGVYYVTGDYTNQLVIAGSPTVILANATIKCAGSPIKITSGSPVIMLEETNRLEVTSDTSGGALWPMKGTTITLRGKGVLEAIGDWCVTGIGGGMYNNAGDINIDGGTILAIGGYYSAGIGSGGYPSGNTSCGKITISGGTVTATGGSSGAGIGSGAYASCGPITISGGEVTAKGGDGAAAIGKGMDDLNTNLSITLSNCKIWIPLAGPAWTGVNGFIADTYDPDITNPKALEEKNVTMKQLKIEN